MVREKSGERENAVFTLVLQYASHFLYNFDDDMNTYILSLKLLEEYNGNMQNCT